MSSLINQIKDSILKESKSHALTKSPQYRNQHDADASRLHWEEF